MMYVVVVDHKKIEPLQELLAIFVEEFKHERFAIVGSEGKGFQLRILGMGDEKLPREIGLKFLKKWNKENKEHKEL